MPRKRTNRGRTLPDRICKKLKTVTNLRKDRDIINYDESGYDLLDYLDESEIIEISSDDRSDIVNCANKGRFTDFAEKGQDLLAEVGKDLEKSIDLPNSDTSAIVSNRSTRSISGSDTVSSMLSGRTRFKLSKKKDERRKIEEMYIVEKILAMREIDGVRQFYLKWEGFTESENSWEPEENIDSKDIIMEYLAELERVASHEKSSAEFVPEFFEDVSLNDIVIDQNNKVDVIKSISHMKEIGSIVESTDDIKNPVSEFEKELINESVLDENKNADKISKPKKKRKRGRPTSNKKLNVKMMKGSEIDLTVDDEEIQGKLCGMKTVIEILNVKNHESANTTEIVNKSNAEELIANNENEVDLTLDDEDSKECRADSVVSDKITSPEKFNEAEVDESVNEETTNDSDCVVLKSDSTQSYEPNTSDDKDEVNQIEGSNDEESVERAAVSEREDVSQHDDDVHSQRSDDAFTKKTKHNSKTAASNLNTYFPENLPQDVQEIFQVEKIIRMRYSHGKRFFYLKWEGFPDTENSWEPEGNLECPELIEDFINDLKKEKTKKPETKKPEVRGKRSTSSAPVKAALVLETLPDEVKIKEPAVKPRGFPKEREADLILGSGIVNEELNFLIKWKNIDMANLVPARRANVECPQTVIRFYEKNLKWQNQDGSITITPDEKITVEEEPVDVRRTRIDSKKQLRNSIAACRQLLTTTPGKVGRPCGRPLGSSMVQARKLTTGASRMLNIITNFQARKQELVPAVRPPVTLPKAVPPQVTEHVPSCQYESRDLPSEPSPPPQCLEIQKSSFQLPPPPILPQTRPGPPNIAPRLAVPARANVVHSAYRARQGSVVAGPRSFQQSAHSLPIRPINSVPIARNAIQPVRNKVAPLTAEQIKRSAIEQLLHGSESLSRSMSTGAIQSQLRQSPQSSMMQPFQLNKSFMAADSQPRYLASGTTQYQQQFVPRNVPMVAQEQMAASQYNQLGALIDQEPRVGHQQQYSQHGALLGQEQMLAPQYSQHGALIDQEPRVGHLQQYSQHSTLIGQEQMIAPQFGQHGTMSTSAQAPLLVYQNQYTPLQYQYVMNNNYQQMSNSPNSFAVSPAQNQVYYSQHSNASSPGHIVPRNGDFSSQGSQMPVMLDSQTQQNSQLLRNSYLNLGAFL